MGVYTTADENLDQAKKDIQSAYTNLESITNPETWGSNYSQEFREKLIKAKRLIEDARELLR